MTAGSLDEYFCSENVPIPRSTLRVLEEVDLRPTELAPSFSMASVDLRGNTSTLCQKPRVSDLDESVLFAFLGYGGGSRGLSVRVVAAIVCVITTCM